MRVMHMVNAIAWAANAVVWYGYAHATAGAVLSLAAMAGALVMWRLEP